MKQMSLIEMDGFLKGKCIPRDLKVNETNAEYLVRKFGELESKLNEQRKYYEGVIADGSKHIAELEKQCAEWERKALSNFEECAAMAERIEELPLDYIQGQKDGLEWAAQLAEANHPQTGDWLYDDPVELAKAIRKGPDMPEAAGNSPVIPDGWISCSDRMPDKLIPVMVMYEDGEMWSAMWNGNRWDDGTEYPDPHSVTHWREMPAAPQQEVK